jgi:integrase
MAVWMAIRGQHDASLAMLVGFDCYLRIGELLSLKVQDVAVSNDPRLGSAYRGVLLRLAQTKTGRNQAVTVEDSVVAALLTSHVRDRTESDSVFNVSRDSFYKLFRGACAAFGLDGLNYSPHSLRHGGATRHFLLKRPISDIQFRGRWSNSKSVRTYIQSGRALLLLTQVPSDVFEVASDCAQLIKPLLLYLKERSSVSSASSTSSISASAVTLRAGRRASSDRKVQDSQAS